MNIQSRVAAVPGITLRKRISTAIKKYSRAAKCGCFLDRAIDAIKTTRITRLSIIVQNSVYSFIAENGKEIKKLFFQGGTGNTLIKTIVHLYRHKPKTLNSYDAVVIVPESDFEFIVG